jgi:hypothetical protein
MQTMKKIFLLLAFFIATESFAQRKSPHDTVSNGNVTVTYGRPYKNNRAVFGGLEKFGKVWRVGADEATTITFKNDVKFGGHNVKAGTYTLFAIPNEKEWTIILNKELGQWGAYGYKKENDIASVTVPITKTDKAIEQLTISIKPDNTVVIGWDDTQVSVPVG